MTFEQDDPYTRFSTDVRLAFERFSNARSKEWRALEIGQEVLAICKDINRKTDHSMDFFDSDGQPFSLVVMRPDAMGGRKDE